MALIYVDGETLLEEEIAKEAAETLNTEYPNHSWWVECRGGCLIVKHFMLSGYRGVIGMVRHVSALDHSYKVRKRAIIKAGGVLLERANLARSAYTGEVPGSMELEGKQMRKYWHSALPIGVIHE